ncbi:MAG: WD40 repeat domain-containing protein [Chloroflexi bacterium]|nr:WD40 repeat domain-containing protein [Chloroflexota bacterium]
MKNLLNPLAGIVGIVGVAVFVFMVLRVFSLTMQVSNTGAVETPTLEIQISPTSTAQWNVNRVEIVAVQEVSSSSELLANRGTQLLDPKFSPDGEKILWVRYTGEFIPCSPGNEKCFHARSDLVLYSLQDQGWSTLAKNATEANWSPNGKRVSYLAQKASGKYDLAWIDVKTQVAATLVKDVAFTAANWVGNNDLIFSDTQGNLNRVDINGKVNRSVTDILAMRRVPGPGAFTVSPDGDLAAVVKGNDVWLVSLAKNQSKVELGLPADYLQYSNLIHGLRWSSKGSYLAMIASDNSILVYDRKGHLQRQLVVEGERATFMAWSPDEQSIAVIRQARTESGTDYAVTLLGVSDAATKNVFVSSSRKQTLDWSPLGRVIAVGQDDQKPPILAEIKSR